VIWRAVLGGQTRPPPHFTKIFKVFPCPQICGHGRGLDRFPFGRILPNGRRPLRREFWKPFPKMRHGSKMCALGRPGAKGACPRWPLANLGRPPIEIYCWRADSGHGGPKARPTPPSKNLANWQSHSGSRIGKSRSSMHKVRLRHRFFAIIDRTMPRAA